MRRVAPTSGWWLRRLGQRFDDLGTIVAFSLFPVALQTSMSVNHVVLQIQQWRGVMVGSGGYLWGGSRRLAHYLETHGDGSPSADDTGSVPSRRLQTLTLLELGSGTGAVGLAAAVLGADVTITDQASFSYPGRQATPGMDERPIRTLLELARSNVDINHGVLAGSNLMVQKLLWGDLADEAALPHGQYDIICGGDILLFTRAHAALLCSLRNLSIASTVVLLEHTDRGADEMDYPLDLAAFLRSGRACAQLPTSKPNRSREVSLVSLTLLSHSPLSLSLARLPPLSLTNKPASLASLPPLSLSLARPPYSPASLTRPPPLLARLTRCLPQGGRGGWLMVACDREGPWPPHHRQNGPPR